MKRGVRGTKMLLSNEIKFSGKQSGPIISYKFIGILCFSISTYK